MTTGIKHYQVVNQKTFLDTWKTTIASYGLAFPTPEYIQRDRVKKGRVLFVDDMAPQTDRNAGAVLSECYMWALHQAGYAVTFLPYFDVRYDAKYTRALQERGIECLYWPYLQSPLEHVRLFGPQFDYVIVSRASVAQELIDVVKESAPQARVLFNTIDLHFMRLERGAALTGSEEERLAALKARESELDVIRKSDCTLVVSDVEAALLAGIAPQSMVRTVPFPADVFEPATVNTDRQDIVYLGGFRHPPNIDAVHYFAREIWPLIEAELPKARFIVAGPDPPPDVEALAGERVLVTGFVEDLSRVFSIARISVAPLRYGAGIKGKILTSLGYGVPSVATSLAAEGMGLIDGRNIVLADTPDAFAGAILRLFHDPALWNLMSTEGQDFLRKHYSRHAIAEQLLDVIHELPPIAGYTQRRPSDLPGVFNSVAG